MSDAADPARAAEALLRAQGHVPPASVAPLVSVVRSGEQFLLVPPASSSGTGGGTAPGTGAANTRRILLEWGYEVPREQYGAFQTFISDSNATLLACPAGIAYLGTYTVFQQSERSLGSFRTIWGFERLSLMEEMTLRVADPKDDWGKAVKQLMAFRDPSYAAGRSQVILQLAAATLMA
ncbi:hypothetical protein SAMN02745194_00789 [Roseomonas rosea]|jgi:hypothetical protein|uniref:Uncharacterized protein n=1 Tax=Muricoccus roseus TaxID=198092 RepID=A0A1M6D244_9PROT|nr:hypothetical protein [Roseomonas rosea]SHI67144.1 hypothetical protein SAMN02745194_00789 [Roseomonas rosea]